MNPQHQSGPKCKGWWLEKGKQKAGRENGLSQGSKLLNHHQSSHVDLRHRNHCRKPILTPLSYRVSLDHTDLRNHSYFSTVLLQVSGQGGTASPQQLLPMCQKCPPHPIPISTHHYPQLLPPHPLGSPPFSALPLFFFTLKNLPGAAPMDVNHTSKKKQPSAAAGCSRGVP